MKHKKKDTYMTNKGDNGVSFVHGGRCQKKANTSRHVGYTI